MLDNQPQNQAETDSKAPGFVALWERMQDENASEEPESWQIEDPIPPSREEI